jgi:hypothetical protein
MPDLTQMELLSVDSPAKMSAWLENALDYLTPTGTQPEAVYFGKLSDFSKKQKRSTSSSKMSLDYFQATKEEISELSSMRWSNSGMAFRGEYLMLNTLESPNAAVESSLSEVLETQGEHLHKYSISPKAAAGILRRASKRGKFLPEQLQKSLENVVYQSSESAE